jgi:signal transduction histidine kinase/CheY-like chemotaxis protein
MSQEQPPITDSERRLRFLDELAQATRALEDPVAVMQLTVRMLGEHLRVSRCCYAHVDADQDHLQLVGEYTDAVPSILGRHAFSDFGEPVLALMRAGLPYVNDDVDTHELTAGTDLVAYRLAKIKSALCVPLHLGKHLVAAMAVHQDHARHWSADEIDLLQRVVARCWESLDRLRSHEQLRVAHQRLSLAMAAGELGDWSWDAQTDLVTLSDRAAEILGVPPNTPRSTEWMRNLLHPDDKSLTSQELSKVEANRAAFDIQYRVRRGRKDWVWVRNRAKGVYDDEGRLVGLTGVAQDVTPQRLAQEAESAARQEAERANRIKDEFLATLSHELRTPLGAILGWAHILRRKLPADDPEVVKGIEVIERSTRVQTQLIDDLLDMSRITSGKLRLTIQPMAPISFVEAAIETVMPSAEAAGVAIESKLDPGAGPVAGDASRLQQVVWNLLANAIKFTPRGGTVTVSLKRIEDAIQISVSDTGAGISPEFLPHIFDRFRQADGSTTRRFGGLGLGLSIVKHLVQLHHGEVSARSAGEGQGACFEVRLPIATEHLGVGEIVETRANDAVPAACAEPGELDGLTVLVVDDEPDTRDLLERVLRDAGARVLLAGDAATALALVEAQRPQVLVSDIGMPDIDGYELLRQVRELGASRGGSVPAVALTAFARSEDRIRALRAGFSVHVAKPVEPSEIVATVASVAVRATSAPA